MKDRIRNSNTRRTAVATTATAPGPQIVVDSRNERTLGLDDFLFRRRKLYLVGPVDEGSAYRLILGLQALAEMDPKADITLYIDSPGGLVTAGNAILEAMDEVPCDIRTVCVGQAASMGAIIFGHGTPGKREVGPKSRVLIHQPSAGTRGKTTDEEIDVAESTRLRKQSAKILAEDTGQTPENVEKDFKDDLWLNADQAIEYGLADRLLQMQRPGFQARAVSPPSLRAAQVLAERAAERAALAQGGAVALETHASLAA